MNNKFKANTALLLSALGAAFTLPTLAPVSPATSIGHFTLGLLNHGFLAATIGGLADWFAVTALFRKPLGISFRTQILIRNRKRIMDAIVEFVSSDLLNTRNIMNTVRNENTAALLVDYFNRNDGRRKLKELVFSLAVELAANADTKAFAQSVTPLVQREISSIDHNQIIGAITNVITNQRHSKKILAFICDAAQDIFHANAVQRAVLQKITSLRRDYEGSSPGRVMLLNAIDLTDEKILSILNDNVDKKISDTVKALQDQSVDPDATRTAADFNAAFNDFVRSAADDVSARNFINGVRTFFNNNLNLAEYLKFWLDKNLKGQTYVDTLGRINRNSDQPIAIELDRNELQWRTAIERLVDEKIDGFINSPMQQDAFDRFVKKSVEKILDDYHETIPNLINERLEKFSNEELTEFVESHVADDLQMIRINGAVCGACVGIGLYIVSWLLRF